MDSIIISSKDDKIIRGLKKELRAKRIDILKPKPPTGTGEYQPTLDGLFLLVDMRDKRDYQELGNLHGEYPGAKLVCFFKKNDVDTITATTFGGVDISMDITTGVHKIVEAAIQETEIGKTNFRQPIGMTFTAGNVFFNTKTQRFRELPVGFETVAKALPHPIIRESYFDRGYGNGTLSPQQCVFLESLKLVRDKLTDPSETHDPVSFETLSDALYKPHRRPENSSAKAIADNLTEKFKNKAPTYTGAHSKQPSIDPRKQVIIKTDDDKHAVLSPAYEHMP